MNEELKIVIKAEIGELQKNLKQAQDAVEETASKGSKLKSIGTTMGKVAGTVAKVGAAAFATVGAGIGAITKQAIDNYAEYEQLVGGVETLFKDSAGIVQGYADNAYKSAGMSANDYMSTVTSFSASLLQSLDGDTAAAAEAANTAVVDMADNANKMGSSMESIQNAYQGFAKQNYTMLDNLKLGYGGTKEEMQRLLDDASKISGIEYDMSNLNDVYSAIHIVQTELGITGTTAKEAGSTIQGSAAAMKASWSNLLTGMADENADFDALLTNFIDSVGTFAENLIPRIGIALQGATKLITGLASALAAEIPKLAETILPMAITAVTDIIVAIAAALPSLIGAIVAVIPSLISGIVTAFTAIVESLPLIIEAIVGALPTIIPALIDGVLSMVVTLCESIGAIITPIIEALPDIIISIIEALMNNLPSLISGLITLILALVEAIPQIMQALVEAMPTVISMLIDSTLSALPQIITGLIQVVAGVIKAIPQIFGTLIQSIVNYYSGIWNGLAKVFGKVGSWFGDRFKEAVKGIKSAFSGINEWFSGVLSKIGNVFKNVGSWFKNKFNEAVKGIKSVFSTIGSFFSGVWQSISNIFSNVGATIGNAITNTVKTAINGVLSTAVKIINGFISAINWAIDVINKIPGVNIGKLNSLSVPKMAKGGIVDSATLAVIGEQGKEAVVPLENNTEWLDKLATRLTAAIGGGNVPVVLNVDGKTFAETSVRTINDLTRARGSLALNIV